MSQTRLVARQTPVLVAADINAALGYDAWSQNRLVNGGLDFWQRHAANNVTVTTLRAVANNVYWADRWLMLTDGGTTDMQTARVAGDTASRYGGQIKQTNATAKKFGCAQFIETSDSIEKRGRTFRFQIRAKSSSTPGLRVAILEWTGTADTLSTARDLINNWANSADANPATTFFKSTTINVLGYSAATTLSSSFQEISITGLVGNSCNNLIVVVWTSAAVAQNVTVDVTQADLYAGTLTRVWTPKPIQQETALAMRYYEWIGGTDCLVCRGYNLTSKNILMVTPWSTAKRTTPTGTVMGTWDVLNCAQPSISIYSPNNLTFNLYSPITATGDGYFDASTSATGVSGDAEL